MRHLAHELGITAATNVLDVGGTPEIWSWLPFRPRVTFLNLSLEEMHTSGVIADGRHLPFRDGTFDIVFSNSVIEHIDGSQARHEFARECRRVGRRYYIQTPNWWFPVEPHCVAPFIHWIPKRLRECVVRFTPHGFLDTRAGRPTEYLAHIALLDRREMKRLFPESEIWTERFLGLSKSLIAVKTIPGDESEQ